MPATSPAKASTPEVPARDDEYNPEVPTFTNDVTPEVSVRPDDSTANERFPALADKSAAPDTPATPVDSAPYVPPTPVNNATTDRDHTSPMDSVSQPPSVSTTGSQARDAGGWYRQHGARTTSTRSSSAAKPSCVSLFVTRRDQRFGDTTDGQRHLCVFLILSTMVSV